MRIVSAQHRHKRPPRRRRPALCQIALAHSGFHSGPRKSRPSAARMRHACALYSKTARGIANEIIRYGFRPMVKVARSAPAESGRIRITSTCQSAFQQERPLTTTTARWSSTWREREAARNRSASFRGKRPEHPPARYPAPSPSILPQGTTSLPRASSRKVPAPSTSILLQRISPLLRNQHLRFALNRRCGSFFDLLPTRFFDLARISLAQEDQCNFLCCKMPVQNLLDSARETDAGHIRAKSPFSAKQGHDRDAKRRFRANTPSEPDAAGRSVARTQRARRAGRWGGHNRCGMSVDDEGGSSAGWA